MMAPAYAGAAAAPTSGVTARDVQQGVAKRPAAEDKPRERKRPRWVGADLGVVPASQLAGLRVRVWCAGERERWVPGRLGEAVVVGPPVATQGAGEAAQGAPALQAKAPPVLKHKVRLCNKGRHRGDGLVPSRCRCLRDHRTASSLTPLIIINHSFLKPSGHVRHIMYGDGSGAGVVDVGTMLVQVREGNVPEAVAAAAARLPPQEKSKQSRKRSGAYGCKAAASVGSVAAAAAPAATAAVFVAIAPTVAVAQPAAVRAAAGGASLAVMSVQKGARSRPKSKLSRAAAAALAEKQKLDPAEASRRAAAAAALAARYPGPVEGDAPEKQVSTLLSMTAAGVPMPTLTPTLGKLAAHAIATMDQRTLQRRFQMIYGTPTSSNNNVWLRRKLAEGIGLRPLPPRTSKGRPTVHFVRERQALWLAACLHMEHLLAHPDAAALARYEAEPVGEAPTRNRSAGAKGTKGAKGAKGTKGTKGAKIAKEGEDAKRKRKRPTAAELRAANAARLLAEGGLGGADALAAATKAADVLLERAQQSQAEVATSSKSNRAAQKAAREKREKAAEQRACDRAWDAALAAPETPADVRRLRALQELGCADIFSPTFKELSMEERADNAEVSMAIPPDRYMVAAPESARERPSMQLRPASQLYAADSGLLPGGADDGSRVAYRAQAPSYDCDSEDEAWLSAEADSLTSEAGQDAFSTYETLVAAFELRAKASVRARREAAGSSEPSEKGSLGLQPASAPYSSKEGSLEPEGGSIDGPSGSDSTIAGSGSAAGIGGAGPAGSPPPLQVEEALAAASEAGVTASEGFVRAIYARWVARRHATGYSLLKALQPGPLLPAVFGDGSGAPTRAFSGKRPALLTSRSAKRGSLPRSPSIATANTHSGSVANLTKVAATAGGSPRPVKRRKQGAKPAVGKALVPSHAAEQLLDDEFESGAREVGDQMELDSLGGCDSAIEGTIASSLLSGDCEVAGGGGSAAAAGGCASGSKGDDGGLLLLGPDMFDSICDVPSSLGSPVKELPQGGALLGGAW